MNEFLDIMTDDIITESIELQLERIDYLYEIGVLTEGTLDNFKEATLKFVEALIRKIHEIVEYIQETFFTKDDQKYEEFIKALGNKTTGIAIDFEKSPRRVYELYIDIYKVISMNYDKLSKDTDKKLIEQVRNKLDMEVYSENLGVPELLNLFKKYNDLARMYKDLSKKLSSYIKTKAKNGEKCEEEKQLLSTIVKIVNDIRNNMNKISPKKICGDRSFKGRVNELAETGKLVGKVLSAAFGLGIVAYNVSKYSKSFTFGREKHNRGMGPIDAEYREI